MNSTSVRLGARLARRELRRRPWRSTLVLLLVILPTAAMALVATFLRTSEWSTDDQVRANYGQADYSGFFALPEGAADRETAITVEALAALRAELPAGSRFVREDQADDRYRDGARRAYFTMSNVPLDDPIVDGRFLSFSGRTPAGPGEAAVTQALARRLDLDIGDRFRPERLGRELTVVGTFRSRSWPSDMVVTDGPIDLSASGRSQLLIDLPGRPFAGAAGQVVEVVEVPGWHLTPAAGWHVGSKTESVFWTYVGGGVGLAVLGTVIAAAFAVGARRQLRTLGLLSSTGASPSTLRWFLVLQGVTTGAVGSAVGIGLGVLAAHLTPVRYLDSIAGRAVEGAVTRPLDLLPILLIGTAAAGVAAWLPARSVTAVPTLQALAGRRPLARVPHRVPMLGAVSIGAGCALFAMAVAGSRDVGSSTLWALVAVAGGLACLFGALAVAPWAVAGLERASGRWSGSLRLAGRSLARSRVRSSAVVGAICAVAASVIAGATLFNSFEVEHSPDPCCQGTLPYIAADQVLVQSGGFASEDGPPAAPTVDGELLRQLRAVVPGIEPLRADQLVAGTDGHQPVWGAFVDTDGLTTDSGGNLRIGVADGEILGHLGATDEVRAAVARGEAVSVVEPRRPAEAVRLMAVGDGAEPLDPVEVPLGATFASPSASRVLPQVLVPRSFAERHGFVHRPGSEVVLLAPGEIDDSQLRALQVLADDLRWEQGNDDSFADDIHLQLPDEPDPVSQAVVKTGVLGVAFLLVLAVVGVGLALAAKDSEDERQVLAAVGAPPKVQRRVAAWRAALLVATAAVIAVPTALLPSAAIVEAITSDAFDGRAFRPDVWALGFVVLVLPVGVGLLAAGGAAVRDRFRPARAEVFTFTD